MSKLISKNSILRFKRGGSQRPKLDPNRYISIYDDGIWRKNAEEAGVTDRDSVKALQKKLGVEADGIWGKNTNAAYEAWKLKNSTSVTETPITETPTINKPTINNPGYYAIPVDYDNAESFNLLGIKDYNTLKLFVIDNPRHQFSLDMIRRFKDTDLWTQNNIESALKVKGKYRNGYQGDLYDIRKSMKNYIQNNPRPLEYVDINDYMIGLESRFPFLKKQFKNGGQLVSCNPITRFRLGGMLRKLLNGYKIVGTDDLGYPIYLAVDSNALALIEALAAKEVLDFLNSLRASKLLELEFSPVDVINTWKNIITVPKKESTIKSLKKSSKNNSNKKYNSNKKNKSPLSQKKVTVIVDYATDPDLFPIDPMPNPSRYENILWGRMYEPTAPYEQTRPYVPRRYGL